MTKWTTSKLGEACEIIKRGISPKYIEEGGICVVNQKCIRNHEINYTLSRRHNVSVKSVNPERIIQIGDVLVNSTGTGTLGRVAQVRTKPEELTTVDTHVTIVRPKKNIFHDDFFGYMLIKIEDEITESGSGASGQTELARTVLENKFHVSFPESIETQKQIVAKLDQAFADIEKAKENAEQNLNNANELLLSQRHEMFHAMSLESDLVPLTSVCDEIFAGGDAPKGNFSKDLSEKYKIPIYANAVKNNGLYGFTDIARALKPAITVAARGSGTGHVAMRMEPFFPIVRLIVLIPNDEIIILEYLKYAILGLDILSSGSAIPQLTVPMIKGYSVPLPSLDVQRLMIEKFNKLSEQIACLESIYKQKISSLDELKQSILQKAFNGELA
jgi:type I restriction enzyme S subunit